MVFVLLLRARGGRGTYSAVKRYCFAGRAIEILLRCDELTDEGDDTPWSKVVVVVVVVLVVVGGDGGGTSRGAKPSWRARGN